MIAQPQGIRIRHRGRQPQVHPTAYVAPTATLVGDVRVGPRARVMYGAVLDAEGSRIEAGEAAVISENAVLRGSAVARVAFGVGTEWIDRITRYEHIAEVRVAEFGANADDEILYPDAEGSG
ncbi:hypothetical protein AB0K12_38720 [Nonomuraea sp. NPDC049419]|uniref:hypothetical protein n=1 Tax=Nonomuraea sp. NPDC049419 TaxID=3155772 RepID=UPI003414DF6B